MSRAGVLALTLFAFTACRLGGPVGNPDEYIAFADATTADAPSTLPGDDATSSGPGDDATAPAAGDGGGDDGGSAGDDGGCASTVAVCDPVHNTGCDPLHQCDVNPLQATTPTGVCVFGGQAEGGACTASIFNESCAPSFTCVDGGCRHLCHCNADCPASECCSDTSGPAGFTLCGACM